MGGGGCIGQRTDGNGRRDAHDISRRWTPDDWNSPSAYVGKGSAEETAAAPPVSRRRRHSPARQDSGGGGTQARRHAPPAKSLAARPRRRRAMTTNSYDLLYPSCHISLTLFQITIPLGLFLSLVSSPTTMTTIPIRYNIIL